MCVKLHPLLPSTKWRAKFSSDGGCVKDIWNAGDSFSAQFLQALGEIQRLSQNIGSSWAGMSIRRCPLPAESCLSSKPFLSSGVFLNPLVVLQPVTFSALLFSPHRLFGLSFRLTLQTDLPQGSLSYSSNCSCSWLLTGSMAYFLLTSDFCLWPFPKPLKIPHTLTLLCK